MRPLESPADVAVVRCADIDAAIAELTHEQGYRLDMIMPADQPRVAELSRGGERIRLEVDAIEPASPDLPGHGGFLLTRAGTQGDWTLAGDSCVVPTGADVSFAVGPGCEFLQVSVQCDGLADATARGG